MLKKHFFSLSNVNIFVETMIYFQDSLMNAKKRKNYYFKISEIV